MVHSPLLIRALMVILSLSLVLQHYIGDMEEGLSSLFSQVLSLHPHLQPNLQTELLQALHVFGGHTFCPIQLAGLNAELYVLVVPMLLQLK